MNFIFLYFCEKMVFQTILKFTTNLMNPTNIVNAKDVCMSLVQSRPNGRTAFHEIYRLYPGFFLEKLPLELKRVYRT